MSAALDDRFRVAARAYFVYGVVYLVGGFEDRYPKLLERLGPHTTGKACLYLKRLADVDLDVLRQLVERSVRVARGVDKASRS